MTTTTTKSGLSFTRFGITGPPRERAELALRVMEAGPAGDADEMMEAVRVYLAAGCPTTNAYRLPRSWVANSLDELFAAWQQRDRYESARLLLAKVGLVEGVEGGA